MEYMKSQYISIKIIFVLAYTLPFLNLLFFSIRSFFLAKKGLKLTSNNQKSKELDIISLLIIKIFFRRKIFKLYAKKYNVKPSSLYDLFLFTKINNKPPSCENRVEEKLSYGIFISFISSSLILTLILTFALLFILFFSFFVL